MWICSDDWREIFMKQSVNNIDKLASVIFVQLIHINQWTSQAGYDK